jgi:hypothetical protein
MRFRPGARYVRSGLGIIVTFLIAGGCAPAPDRASHTVADYQQDARLRQEVLARCIADPGSLQQSPDCVNVREADRRSGVGNLRDLAPMNLPETKK